MKVDLRGTVYWYDFSIRGQRFRGSCFTGNEDMAKRVLAQRYEEAWKEIQLGEKPRKTWVEAKDKWLGEHEHKRSQRDDVRYAEFWTKAFNKLGLKYLDEITPDDVADIRDDEVGRPKIKREGFITPATVNRHLSFLRAVINAAAREWLWISVAPKYKLLEEGDWRMRFLTPPEFQRLHAALPEPYKSCALFAVSTGLRRGNVFGLRWDMVTMRGGTAYATFPQMVMKNGRPFSTPLTPTAQGVLRSQMGKHPELVFPRGDGQLLQDIPAKMWKKALADAGLTDLRWHDLRHTWASWLRQTGVSLDRLQELGGWQDEEMVRRYAHLNVEHLMAHASQIEQMFSGVAAPVNVPFLAAVG
jgi:integrase